MFGRLATLGLVLLSGAATLQVVARPEAVRPRQPLRAMPTAIDDWRGRDGASFSREVMEILGADQYLNRVYTAADGASVAFYLGYYNSQRRGSAIHSPMNCIPGAGWQPDSHSFAPIAVRGSAGAARTIVVNRYIVRKGGDRRLLLYWYQSHGRVVASDYLSRAYMVYDALLTNRTDAALVWVVTPIADSDAEGSTPGLATRRATAFVRAAFPHISALLPL